jgi:hypothetical protein
MSPGMPTFFQEWRDLWRFRSLSRANRSIVFYSEGAESEPHLGPILVELVKQEGRQVCYVTSSSSDPMLAHSSEQILTFVIGSGSARTSFFSTLQADAVVMTTPDLENMHIKRSNNVGQYVYVHHSIVSTHMSYRPGAFDHFDSILCVGPHHIEEIRRTEQLFDLEPKHLVEVGYSRLDQILIDARQVTPRRGDQGKLEHVLIAPSWGPNSILDVCGSEAIGRLLDSGRAVTVRPHPMTTRLQPEMLAGFEREFRTNKAFHIDIDAASNKAHFDADVMVADWGGVALEYAFAFERPVVFIDLPRKVTNPGYTELGIEPLEERIRSSVGTRLAPDKLDELPEYVSKALSVHTAESKAIADLRSQWVYNVGTSASVAARYIAEVTNLD